MNMVCTKLEINIYPYSVRNNENKIENEMII